MTNKTDGYLPFKRGNMALRYPYLSSAVTEIFRFSEMRRFKTLKLTPVPDREQFPQKQPHHINRIRLCCQTQIDSA